MLKAIEEAWSWTGLVPEEVLRCNAFGNVEELLAFSGDIAGQIQDLPDGAQIKLAVK